MSLLWSVTVPAGDHRYSFIFCVLFFFVGACSATSNVTHFTYVSVFPSNETTALSTGMALGSMLAGVLGILQGTVLGDVGMSISSNYLAVAALYVPALWLTWTKAPIILPPATSEEEEEEAAAGSRQALLGRSSSQSYQGEEIIDEYLDVVDFQVKKSSEERDEQKGKRILPLCLPF